jgi:hypothetical protein
MATKKTRVPKKRKGAQLKDLKPKKDPKGGAIGRIEPRFPR